MILTVFRRLVLAAAIGGVAAGLIATGAQMLRAVPLILEAETYETTAPAEDAAASDTTAVGAEDGHDHEHGAGWAPADGLERAFFTALANLATGIGFGLLLAAAFALKGEMDWRRGLLWGLAGFATFSLAPALGLPPELPGANAAALGDRQLWWVATVIATGFGLWLMIGRREVWSVLLGAALLLAPHIVGAPQPEEHGGLAPHHLAQEFVTVALVTSFVFWAVLGGVTGFAFRRLGPSANA